MMWKPFCLPKNSTQASIVKPPDNTQIRTQKEAHMKAIVNGQLVFPDRITAGNILIDGERIIASGGIPVPAGAEIIDAKGLYVGPGFIDQHSHGYQQYGEGIRVEDDPVGAAAAHLKHGTTTYLPSTDYSDTLEEHLRIIKICKKAIADGNTSIMGVHLEGPYINRNYGASSDTAMCYSDEICEKIFSEVAPVACHCTYAPELPDAPAIEEKLRKYGITGAIGHSCAGPEDIERAVAGGARIATHLYDATGHYIGLEAAAKMTQHPQDCTSDILLAIPGLYYELICDSHGAHATKYSVCRAYRTAGENHIILISDATVHEQAGGVADINFNAKGQLSGSRLCVAMAAKNFRRFTGADVRVTFKCASTNSAKAMGLYREIGSIDAGKLANLVFVDDDFTVRSIIFKGSILPDVRV